MGTLPPCIVDRLAALLRDFADRVEAGVPIYDRVHIEEFDRAWKR